MFSILWVLLGSNRAKRELNTIGLEIADSTNFPIGII